MRRREYHGTGGSGSECLPPSGSAHAPLISRIESRESVVGHRRSKVIAVVGAEGEELGRDAAAHHVHAGIVTTILATAGAVEAGNRIVRAGLELGPEHVELLHTPMTARLHRLTKIGTDIETDRSATL
jgi:hypothetical protein